MRTAGFLPAVQSSLARVQLARPSNGQPAKASSPHHILTRERRWNYFLTGLKLTAAPPPGASRSVSVDLLSTTCREMR